MRRIARHPVSGGVAAVLLVAALAAAPAAAFQPPAMSGTIGRTLAVTGEPDDGGWSLALGATWPIEERLRFGLGVFADDMGAGFGRLSDPNDGTDLGIVPERHRATLGAAWRLDAEFAPRRGWAPFASGTWGAYRIADDFRGQGAGAVGATGFSLGAGVRRPLAGRVAFGASVRYHRLFDDRVGRWVTAGVDWAWR